MTTAFIHDFDKRAAETARVNAWHLIKSAREMDPDRYPSDADWRKHFIVTAMRHWNTYRHYRKAAQQ
jgi:hypothetical protein